MRRRPPVKRRKSIAGGYPDDQAQFLSSTQRDGEEWRPAGSVPPAPTQKSGKFRVSGDGRNKLDVSFVASRDWHEPLIVEIALLAHGVRTDVGRGENAGAELHHEFVALALIAEACSPSGTAFTWRS